MDLTLHDAASRPPCGGRQAILLPPKRARGEALRAMRLDRIRAYIGAHLTDPDLSAHAAARALGMSVRSLHLALAETGESFGDLVLCHRLSACYMLLQRPNNTRTIADIAFDCGFNSLSSFYRAFRRVYGVCPREATQAPLELAA